MKIDWKEESQRFDGVAERYDTFRPGYPEELIDAIVATVGLAAGARILEIGCGTGKATALFARRGYSILCVEPGRNLAAVAVRNLKGYPVEFEIARFEEWNERVNEFDLAISAQAFHWVPKEIGYAKIARALRPDGWLALFWNRYPSDQGAIFEELEQVYRAHDPALSPPMGPVEEQIQATRNEVAASHQFGDVQVKTFAWSARYSTQAYLGLLGTYSDHLRLEQAERGRLFTAIAKVIDRHGGYIDKPYLTVLYLAKKMTGRGER